MRAKKPRTEPTKLSQFDKKPTENNNKILPKKTPKTEIQLH